MNPLEARTTVGGATCGSGRSTPRRPTPSRTWTTTCARRSWQAARSTCAARSARTWTPAQRRRRRREAQTEKGDGQRPACCCPRPAAQLEHIVKCTVYLTDIRYREAVYRVIGERLQGRPLRSPPAWWSVRWPDPSGWWRSTVIAVLAVTFSMAARCARTGMFGVVVVSSSARRSPPGAPRCAPASARSAPRTSPTHGSARPCCTRWPTARTPTPRLRRSRPGRTTSSFRQLAVVDSRGAAQAFSGVSLPRRPRRARPASTSSRPATCLASATVSAGDGRGVRRPPGPAPRRPAAGRPARCGAGRRGEEGPVHSAGTAHRRHGAVAGHRPPGGLTATTRSASWPRCGRGGRRRPRTTSPERSTRPPRRPSGCPVIVEQNRWTSR